MGESTDIETTVPPEILDRNEAIYHYLSGNTHLILKNTFYRSNGNCILSMKMREGLKKVKLAQYWLKFQNQNNTVKNY